MRTFRLSRRPFILRAMTTPIDVRSRMTAPEGRFKISPADLTGIAMHHSVSGDNLGAAAGEGDERAHLTAIDRYHVQQQFGGIGYHLAVFPSGRIYQLGDLDGARAHVAGRNHELLGIVAIGTFTETRPALRQLAALQHAVRHCRAYAGRELPVRGHGEWSLPGQGTICPGLLRDIDWDGAEQPAAPAMIRFNGIARSLEGRELPHGISGGVLEAVSEFALPRQARLVRIEVALVSGAFALGDDTYAGRVDERYGARLGIIDAHLLPGGGLAYDCPPGTVIERIGCLGYWL